MPGPIRSYLRVHFVHRRWVGHTYMALKLWKRQESSKGKAVLTKFARFHKLPMLCRTKGFLQDFWFLWIEAGHGGTNQ